MASIIRNISLFSNRHNAMPSAFDPLTGIIPDAILNTTRTEVRVPERVGVA